MAIAYDNATGAQAAFAISLSFSHVDGSGSDRLIVVGVGTNGTAATHNSVTYNGVALTKRADVTTGSIRSTLWSLIAPATGSNTVAIAVSGTEEDTIFAGAITYTGVDQTTPHGTANTAAGSSATPSVDVSSAVGEVVVDCCIHGAGNTALTAGAGQTIRWHQEIGGGADVAAGSEEAGATSVTMSYTAPVGSDDWGICGIPLKPAAAAGGGDFPPIPKSFSPFVNVLSRM